MKTAFATPAPSPNFWRLLPILLAMVTGVVVWSWINAPSRATWWLEAFPVFLAVPVLLYTARRSSRVN